MKATIKTKRGTQTIYINSFDAMKTSPESIIFKAIEYMFESWFSYNTQPGAPLANDIKLCYLGSDEQPRIYNRKGAIRGAIENLIEYIKDNKITYLTSRDLLKLDCIEDAFQI